MRLWSQRQHQGRGQAYTQLRGAIITASTAITATSAADADPAASPSLDQPPRYDVGDVIAIVVFSVLGVVGFLACVGACVRRRRRAVLGMFTERVWALDGGLASTLQSSGYKVDGDPLWSARLLSTHPHAIQEAHRAFLNSGAEVIESASYQASVPGLQRHLGTTGEEALALITLSATLAQQAVDEWEEERRKRGEEGPPRVAAGSVGPYGACQADGSEYTGAYLNTVSHPELVSWHRPRIQALAGAGLGLLALETIPGLPEALALLEVVREWPELKVWISFTCKDGKHTNFGDNFGEAVKTCYERGGGGGGQLVGVGVNCTPPYLITPLLKEASRHLPPPHVLPRVVYPNSGEQWVAGKGWEGQPDVGGDDDEGSSWPYLGEVGAWGSLGARLVGGCCRLGPGDIKNIAGVVKGLKVTE